MPKPSEWFAPVVRTLEELALPWVLAGAYAANEYRNVPRNTMDVDIYTRWVDGLIAALEDAGYSVRSHTDPDVGHPHLLMLKQGHERIDLLLPTVEYQEHALERARNNVLTVEDVIVHKLLAWRPRDRDDIASILAAGHELDTDYIEHWASEWEVADRWREANA